MTTHLIIPDTQVGPNTPTQFLEWVGRYIIDKKPDTIIHMGDHADMPSLSKYDEGTKASEGARYEADIKAANDGMDLLMDPIDFYNGKKKRIKARQYIPKKYLTLGNHENRINRHVNTYPILEGRLSTDDFNYKQHDWEVGEFLEVFNIDGILYSHFFPRGPNGSVGQSRNGAPNAKIQVQREMISCTAGHKQGLDFHIQETGQRRYYGLIAGSCYLANFDYLTPQGKHYWRGIVVKHNVHGGEYDALFVSLRYLCHRYGTTKDKQLFGKI